jgi:hypothetical protein
MDATARVRRVVAGQSTPQEVSLNYRAADSENWQYLC